MVPPKISAKNPFNFDADPDPHWKKMDPDPGNFYKTC